MDGFTYRAIRWAKKKWDGKDVSKGYSRAHGVKLEMNPCKAWLWLKELIDVNHRQGFTRVLFSLHVKAGRYAEGTRVAFV